MGIAMLKGWLDMPRLSRLDVVEPFPSPDLVALEQSAQGRVRVFANVENLYAANAAPDIIVLAVKPQMMADVVAQITGAAAVLAKAGAEAAKPPLVISIAAGKTIAFFEALFPPATPIIRVMPNTPAAIGKGVSVLCGNRAVTQDMGAFAAALLGVLGHVHAVSDESLMDAVTALSGSGPAYIFYLTEVLEQAGKAIGLPPELARDLARQTVVGSAALMESAQNQTQPQTLPQTPADLRIAVTSPNGTTQAALEVLMAKDGIYPVFEAALNAAARRSRELS